MLGFGNIGRVLWEQESCTIASYDVLLAFADPVTPQWLIPSLSGVALNVICTQPFARLPSWTLDTLTADLDEYVALEVGLRLPFF